MFHIKEFKETNIMKIDYIPYSYVFFFVINEGARILKMSCMGKNSGFTLQCTITLNNSLSIHYLALQMSFLLLFGFLIIHRFLWSPFGGFNCE